ncbi:hypothetical protein BTUL_0017g00790 [Botrytis tulipae]|uniref:Heterokaryon incompatibility domain-containing protein n=1 Tax=Botrytis tulipae TaxID=87230 RepID=A0A4Z1F1W8_9HELO|nr:hypothetical protein BTUL_0017g00790 [Botrytis tulipae]
MSIDHSSTIPRAVAELSSSTRYNDNDHDTSLESLCESFRGIDWSNITEPKKLKWAVSLRCPSTDDYPILTRGFGKKSCSQLLNSSCRICRLIGSLMVPKSASSPSNEASKPFYERRNAFLIFCEVLGETWISEQPVSYLADPMSNWGSLLAERFIIAHKFRNNETAGIRTLEPLGVNFDLLRRMLNKCLEDHEECRSMRVEALRLRVIDVTTKRICQARPDCEYIALSYVWGDNSACKSTQGEFPPVIQDAFTVTEALGYRYLWVDRYCIDQNPSSPHTQSMINQMDLVYSNARATIVAASGNSASDGLPGISVPRYQAHAEIGETHLIEVSDVESDIMLSKWFTRAWTYQEWYFSRRRLVFADSEVLFLCNEGMAKETVLNHGFCPFRYTYSELESMKPPSNLESRKFHHRELESHISGYSKRNLSHDCDSLNAFAGILRYYESVAVGGNRPMSHLCGVPLKLLDYPENEWVLFNLIWYHKVTAHRRDFLPSWSWSGWGGSVTFGSSALRIQSLPVGLAANKTLDKPTYGIEEVTSAGGRIPRIQISLEDRTIDLYSFCRERQLNLHHEIHPKELYITSFVIPLRFCEDDRCSKCEPGMFLGVPVCFDREYNFELHKLGLVLPSCGQFYKDPETHNIIVLHPVADGKYERAGLAVLGYDTHTGDLKNQETDEYQVLLNEDDHLIFDDEYEDSDPRNKT